MITRPSCAKTRLARGFALSLCLGLLAGCQTTDPATRQAKLSEASKKGTQNALVGGALCGLGSLLEGNGADKAALHAAACGAVTGVSGIMEGHKLDKQDAALLAEFKKAKLIVKVHEKNLVLESANAIGFRHGSAVPNAASRTLLVSTAKIIKRFPKRSIDIIGHASKNEPSSLALARANNVRASLIRHGVPAGRAAARGQGAQQNLVSSLLKSMQKHNRRVEIFFVPVK